MKPPAVKLDYDRLPSDRQQRHEQLLDVFGQCLVGARRTSLNFAMQLAESAETRESLGRLHREPYEKVAALQPEHRQCAYEFSKAVLDRFAQELLRLLGNAGTDLRVGAHHSARFPVDIQICDSDTGEVVLEENLSWKGAKSLPDYWGRWVNRYGSEADTGPKAAVDPQ